MLVLGIETASRVSSVALFDNEAILASLYFDTGLDHSASLLVHIDELLKLAKFTQNDLTAVAVSIGPGSFTGLRIGLATAKGLSYALNVPLVTVPTLRALAMRWAFLPQATVFSLADAQKKNAYCAVYRGGIEIKSLSVMPLSEIINEAVNLAADGDTVIIAGDVAAKKLSQIDLPKNVVLPFGTTIWPQAEEIAILGARMLHAGETADVLTAEPLYLRRSEAEELWDKHHANEEKCWMLR